MTTYYDEANIPTSLGNLKVAYDVSVKDGIATWTKDAVPAIDGVHCINVRFDFTEKDTGGSYAMLYQNGEHVSTREGLEGLFLPRDDEEGDLVYGTAFSYVDDALREYAIHGNLAPELAQVIARGAGIVLDQPRPAQKRDTATYMTEHAQFNHGIYNHLAQVRHELLEMRYRGAR